MKAIALAGCALLLGACAGDLAEFNREPVLSRVGSGIANQREAFPVAYAGDPHRGRSFGSLYTNRSEDLFRDTRAVRVGDVVTVRININDRAKLDNNSDRSRNSATSFGFDFLARSGTGTGTNAELNSTIDSQSSSRGRGLTDRSEEVELSIAAVVTEIMPNGNLLISGSQEVRVNYDMRVLNIAGVVRPRDISGNNTVSYDKIAEARISYGGRGRGMEVQQPGWGQQLYDRVIPF